MNASEVVTAFDLPTSARIEQRVPKKLLLENGAPTAADKRRINEGIEELFWMAALKPTTIGVPAYRDETREYLEIAILRLMLRPSAKIERLAELVHRAVPYPVVLIAERAPRVSMSAVHKRWSQGEAGKTVLECPMVTADWEDALDAGRWSTFRDALALGRQPRISLYALYQGWIDTFLTLQAARLTGTFTKPTSAEHAVARRDALRECVRLESDIALIRAAAAKEGQLSKQVELNLELKRLQAAQAAARDKL